MGGRAAMTDRASRPDQEAAHLDVRKLRNVRPREYLMRFVFGAMISTVAGVLTLTVGPKFGGLFLAFPAVLPATLVLLEKKDGLAQAVSDVRGAAIGSLGMIAFAVVAFTLVKRNPVIALAAAAAAWALTSGIVYVLLRLLARVLRERQYLPEIPTEEAASVIEALASRRFTLGLAESCTGGNIAAMLTDVPGAGKVIRGGIVAWSNETKSGLLGVDPSVMAEHGLVSAHVAQAMARQAKKVLGADIGFAITGLEGEPADGQPSGLTYLAVATPDDRTLLRRYAHDHGAGRNRERDVRTSLQLIQKSLDGEPTR
jgi:nicotinamide-nucleotide amidase